MTSPAEAPLSVAVVITQDHEAVVFAEGELDIANEERLEDVLRAASMCAASVQVDLSGVSFMDRRVAELLRRHAGHCEQAGGRLRVRNPAGEPRRVLRLCGLEALLDDSGPALP